MSNAQVTYFTSSMAGAPVLNGTAGSLIGVLDACLVNGWGLQTATSLTVTGGVATITVPTAHNWDDHIVIEVAGATPAALNGRKRVLNRTTTTATFAASGVPDGAATGTITVRRASAGWEKVFSGTNLAVYRSPNVLGTRQWLRVDDTTTTHATIWCAENFSDVSTFTDRWVNGFWFKSQTADTTGRVWRFVGDDRTFYIDTVAGQNSMWYHFGDFTPVRANDPYACSSVALPISTLNSTGNGNVGINRSSYSGSGDLRVTTSVLPRLSNFLSKAVNSFQVANFGLSSSGSQTQYFSGENTGTLSHPIYPNTPDNSLILSRVNVFELTNNVFRGTRRGLFHCPQVINSAFGSFTIIDGQDELSGQKVLIIDASSASNFSSGTNFNSRIAFDITGPWS